MAYGFEDSEVFEESFGGNAGGSSGWGYEHTFSDPQGYSADAPSSLFNDEVLNKMLGDFYRKKQKREQSPSPEQYREIRDIGLPDAGYSKTRQRHSKLAFKQYSELQKQGKFLDEEEKHAEETFKVYKGHKDNFYKETLSPFYKSVFFVEPTDEISAYKELDDHFLDPNNDATEWSNRKAAYNRINEDYKKAELNFQSKQATNVDFRTRRDEIDPAFRRAWEHWKSEPRFSEGIAVKPGEKYAADLLDNWDMGLKGDEDDSVFSIKGLLKQKYDPKVTTDDFMDLMEEDKRADYLSGAGLQIPPSKNGMIGGISNKLRNEERKFLLLRRARDAGITHIMDNGVKKPLDEEFFKFKDFTDEDAKRLELLDQYFKDSNLHRKGMVEYFANRGAMTADEKKIAQEKNKLLRSIVEQRAIELESNGLIDEAINRSESLYELGQIGSWVKTGTLAAEASDLLQNAIAGGGEVSMATWQKLAAVIDQQEALEDHKEKEGYSALAEIQKLEAKQGTTGWMDTINRWLGHPKAIVQTAVESMASLIPAYMNTAPETIGSSAAVGALTGTILPGAGTLAGAVSGSTWGARVNYGVASAFLEGGSKLIEVMDDMGIDTTDPNQLAAAWSNPSAREEMREKAIKKLIPIGIIDAISAGMAGRASAILREPAVLKKIPSIVPGGKKYYKGLTKKASDELDALKKKKRKTGSLDKKETAREEFLDSKVKGINPVESAFSRAARLSDSKVHRYTKMQRAKNAATEMGVQMAFGAGGETAGQLWSREPGDPLDKNAILGEVFGELGGIGSVTSALEIAGKRGNPFSKKEEMDMRAAGFVSDKGQQISSKPDSDLPFQGTQFTVDRAGWQHTAFESDNSGDITAYIADKSNISATIENPDPKIEEPMVNPKLQVMEEYIQGVMNLMQKSPNSNGKLRVAVADRTPDGNKALGYTQIDQETGDAYVYLNPKAAEEAGSDVMGAAIHEFPHILGKTVWGEPQILKWYSELSPAQKQQSMAHYLFKDDVDAAGVSRAHADFNAPGALSEEEQQILSNYEGSTTEEERAMEWFSFEYARTLLGAIYDESKTASVRVKEADPDSTSPNEKDEYLDMPTTLPRGLNTDILNLVDRYVAQPYMKYIGSGARAQSSNIANPTIENKMAGQYVDDKGKPMLSSNAALRPEKMGPGEMHAIILEASGWMKTPDNKLKYVGPEKFEQGVESNAFGDLTQSRNLVLTENQHIANLEALSGIMGSDSLIVKYRQGEYGLELDRTKENPKGYEVKGGPLRSKAENEEIIETRLAQMEAEQESMPRQPLDRKEEAGELDIDNSPTANAEEVGTLDDEVVEGKRRTTTRAAKTPIRQNEELQKARQERLTTEGGKKRPDGSSSYSNIGGSMDDSVITSEKTVETKDKDKVKEGGKVYRDSEGRPFKLVRKLDEDGKETKRFRRDYLTDSQIEKIKFIPGKEDFQRQITKKTEEDKIKTKQGDIDKPALEESVERGGERLLERMGLRTLKEIDKDISTMLKEGIKRGLEKGQIYKTRGYRRFIEERAVSFNAINEAKKKVNKDLFGGGKKSVTTAQEIVPDEGKDYESLITRMERRRKNFAEKFNGATPEQKIKQLKNLLKSSDKKIMEETKDIVDKLKAEKGRFTEEEFVAEVARQFGLEEMADSFKGGRSRLSDRAEPLAVTEAYSLAEELMKDELALLDNKTSDLNVQLQALEGAEKLQKSEWSKKIEFDEVERVKMGADRKPVKDDKGQIVKEKVKASSLTDKQVDSIITDLAKASDTTDLKSLDKIMAVLSISDNANKQKASNAILNIRSVLGADGIKFLKSGAKLPSNIPPAQLSQLKNSIKTFKDIAKAGAIKSVRLRPEKTKALETTRNKIEAVKKRVKKLDAMKEVTGLGSTTQTVNWKNVAPMGKDMFGYYKKQYVKGKDPVEIPVTLGDLADASGEMTVYRKDKDGKETAVPWTNPQNELRKHIENNLKRSARGDWGQKIIGDKSGQTYGDYAIALLHAEAAMREGQLNKTEHGVFPTYYFTSDGTNIVGALSERIRRLREDMPFTLGRLDADVQNEEIQLEGENRSATYKRELERQRAEKLEGADLETYNRWRDMKSFHGAFAEQINEAKEKRDTAVEAQSEKSRILNKVLKIEGAKSAKTPMSKVIKTFEDRENRTPEEDAVLQDLKDFNAKIPKTDTSTNYFNYLEQNRLLPNQRKEDADKAFKLPLNIAAEDSIIVNLANTRLSEEWFHRPSNNVLESYYDRNMVDYQLSVERELDENIKDLETQLALGGSPARHGLIGDFFSKGELFKHGNKFRRAKEDFIFTQNMHNELVLDMHADVVMDRTTLDPDNDEVVPHTPEQAERMKEILKAALSSRERYNLWQFDFISSDELNAAAKLETDGAYVTYSHLVRLQNELKAYEGPATFTEGSGAFGDHKPSKKKKDRNKDPYGVDPEWGSRPVMLDGEEMSWNTAYRKITKKIEDGTATKDDRETLDNLLAEHRKYNRGSEFSGSTNQKLFMEVVDALNKIKEAKTGLSQEEIEYIDQDPILDRSYNLALALRAAITRGDKRLPKSLTTVRIKRNGKWITESDVEKILTTEDLREQWFKDNAFLAQDFVHHFDNLAHSSDPVIRAFNSVEDNNMVKNMLARQALEEDIDLGVIAKRGYTKRLTAAEISEVKKSVSLADAKPNFRKEFNDFVDNLKKAGSGLVYSNNKVRNSRKTWVNQYPILGLDSLKGQLKAKDKDLTFIKNKDGEMIPVQLLLNGDEFFIQDPNGNHQVLTLTNKFKIRDENAYSQALQEDLTIEERVKRLKKALYGVKFRPETQNRQVLAKDRSWQSRKAVDQANQELFEMRRGLEEYQETQKKLTPPGRDARLEHQDNTARVVKKAEENIKKLELEIKGAIKFLETGKGKFTLGENFTQDGLLMENVEGGWGVITKDEVVPAPDNIAAVLDKFFLDQVHEMDHTASSYKNKMSSTREQLSSFTTSPRRLTDFLVRNGLQGANKLAGSYSEFHAESEGGIFALKYLDGVIDEMLNSLADVPAGRIERLNNLISRTQDKAKLKRLEALLEHQVTLQQEFKDVSPADQVMLEHFSMLMENVSKKSSEDTIFSAEDKKVARSVFEGQGAKGEAMSVAVAQSEAPYKDARIVNLGVIEETVNGRKVKTPIRGLLTPAFTTKPDAEKGIKVEPRKVTFAEYEEAAKAGRTIEESAKIVDPAAVVEKKGKINLIPVSARWPLDSADQKTKTAFVYDIKILRSDKDVATASFSLINEKYKNLKAVEKERLLKFEALSEELWTEYNSGAGNMTEEQIANLEKKKLEFLAIKEKQEELELMIAGQYGQNNQDIAGLSIIFGFDNLIPKKKDKEGKTIPTREGAARDKKVKYSPKEKGINLQTAKLRALARMVVAAGGVRHDTAQDVTNAEKQREADAADERRGGDLSGATAPMDFNVDDAASSEAVLSGGVEDLGAPTQEEMDAYATLMGGNSNTFVDEFDLGNSERWIGSAVKNFRPTELLKKLAVKATRRYTNWNNVVDGKIAIPKDGFLKLKSGAYQHFVEQFAAFEDLHPEFAKAFGVDKNSHEAEKINIYSEIYQVMGRTGDLMDQSNREFVNPIGDAMFETKVDQKTLGEYLIALTAPQVNKAALRNHEAVKGNKEDAPVDAQGRPNGSGMTTEEANLRARKLESDPKLAKFISHKNKPIEKIFKIHQRSLELAAESGMIDQDQYNHMLKAAKDEKGNFRRLPFKGMWFLEGNQWADQQEIADLLGGESRASGKGLDQSRKAGLTHGTKGRKEGQWADPMAMLENTIQMHQEAVIQSQRLEPGKMLIEIHDRLKDGFNNDKDSFEGKLWSKLFKEAEEKVDFEYIKVENSDGSFTGRMQKVFKPADTNDTRALFFARKEGEPVMIKFNNDTVEGAALANAAKNLSYQQMEPFFEALNFTTQVMGKLVTSWNPEFWLRNPVRDTSAVFFNMGDSPEGRKARKRILNPKKFMSQAKAIAKYERYLNKHGKVHPDIGDGKIDIARIHKDQMYAYHIMKQQGGKTAFYLFQPIDKLMKQMSKILKEGRSGKGAVKFLRAISQTVEMINIALENAYRVRVFAELLHDGAHMKRAVREARNATVDFNKRGVSSRKLGTFILFSNPTIQGSKRSIQAFQKRGPKGAAQAGFGIFLTFLSWSTIARALSQRDDDEEDDGSTYYDDRGNIKNSSSIGIPLDMFFEKSTGRHFDLPVDFAWTPIVGLADLISKQLFYHGSDKYSPNLIQDIQDYVINSSLAIAPNPFDAGLPVAQPLIDVWNNKKSFGGMPVYNEGPGWNPAASPEEMSTNRTSMAAKAVSNYINRAGGGTEKTPGNWLQLMGGFFGTDIDSGMDLKDPTFKMGAGVSAPVLSYLLKEYTNGLGESVEDLANLMFFPGDTSTKKLPLVNALLKPKTSDFPTTSRYYEMEGRARSIENMIKHWQSSGEAAKVRDYYSRFPEARKLIAVVKAAKKNFESIKRQSKALDKQKLKEASKMQRLDILEERRINTMRQALVKAHKFGIPV